MGCSAMCQQSPAAVVAVHALQSHTVCCCRQQSQSHAWIACAGAADGSVRLWDIASGQAMRVLAHPAKGPVTSLLCLPAPAVLSLPASDRSESDACTSILLWCLVPS